MARPLKYNWAEIKEAYNNGIGKQVISKKYNVALKTLSNKISLEKWEVMGGLNTHIDEFKDTLDKISHNTQNDPIMKEIVMEKLTTILEDNELIGNNRKLLKAFQGLVGRGIKDGTYTTAKDIKAGVGTIRDIESVSNPIRGSLNIQNNNSNQQNSLAKIEIVFPEDNK